MSLDLQLSELRRSLDVATTKIDGQLAVLLQKSDYAEQRARESAERLAHELAARDARMAASELLADTRDEAHNTRMSSLEKKLYFMFGISTTLGSAAGIIATVMTKH